MELFAKATKSRFRFVNPSGGLLTTEDLWALSLETLDKIAVTLDEEIRKKGDSVQSFLKKKTDSDTKLKDLFDVVKFILDAKVADKEKAASNALKRQKRERILEKIAQKQDEADNAKSLDDLRKELDELDNEE